MEKIFSWRNGIFLVLCCVVFYFVVHNFTEIQTVHTLFKQIDGRWITLAIVSQFFTYLFVALIYYLLLNSFKSKTAITLPDLFKLSIVTVFINQVVPSGGIGGNGFLFNEVTNRGVPAKKAFFTIVMECLTLYVSLAVLLIVLPLLYIVQYAALPPVFIYVIIFGFLLYGALAALMTVISVKDALHYVLRKLSRIPFLKHHLEDITFSAQDTFPEYGTVGPWHIFLKYKKLSLWMMVCQWGIFFADAVTIFALLQGLHAPVSFLIISFGLLLTFVAAALPLSPGALLVYEGAMTFFYTAMGIPFGTALVITLLYRVLSFWAPMVMGLLLYRHVQTKKELST
jgi:uncharacterized protein (TIRG00374 family)